MCIDKEKGHEMEKIMVGGREGGAKKNKKSSDLFQHDTDCREAVQVKNNKETG